VGKVFAMEAQKHVRYDHEVPGKLARWSMVLGSIWSVVEQRKLDQDYAVVAAWDI
jgi:hypothetical protein